MNDDFREICVIHANCQGEPLSELLMASPEFSVLWRVHTYTNYTREAIPESILKNATLFLYQHLGREWGDVSSESMLSRLGPHTLRACIPNMFFLGYWPFWTKDSPMDFGDYLLDRLYASGAGKPEILRIYLYGDISKMADFEGIARKSLEMEFAKEERCIVKTADLVAANWRNRRLFQTINHPDAPLLLHVAQGVLAYLGLPPLTNEVCASYSFGYEGFELPIHPRVGGSLGLPFAGIDTRYQVFGRSMTFAQYVSRYVDCRVNNLVDSFLAYLQLV